MGSESYWDIKGDAEWGIQPRETTEFTRTYTDGSLNEEWPNSWDECRITVEGVLADDIREKLNAPGALVEIIEKRTDGGYSEYTQENDYEFRLIVNGAEVLYEDWGFSSIMPGNSDVGTFDGSKKDLTMWNLHWLLDWLERD